MKRLEKILYINNFFSNYGGAEKTMYNEAMLLKSMGVKTYFFATNKQTYFEKDYKYSKFFPKYVNYRELGLLKSFLCLFKPFYNVEAEKKLDRLLKNVKPDIIRCCNIRYHLTPSVLKVCGANNIPVIMSIHDCRLFCPSGNLMVGNRKYCEKLLCVKDNPIHCVINLCKQDKLLPSVIVSLEHLFNKACGFHDSIDAYICQSEAMLELAVKSGISRDKLFLLNTFISNDDFAKRPVYENNSYFLYIGRISKEKGIDVFINAMRSLPEIPVHIIGTGPEEEYYREFVRKNNLHNIKFMGYKSGQELEDEYTNCIATVLPCVWFENFPRSILESFAYGKPAIATKIGGIQEIIDHGTNGFTFDVGNAEMLAKYIKQMFYDKELSRILGQNARQKAEKKYNSKVYSERVMDIYNSVLNKVSHSYQSNESPEIHDIEIEQALS